MVIEESATEVYCEHAFGQKLIRIFSFWKRRPKQNRRDINSRKRFFAETCEDVEGDTSVRLDFWKDDDSLYRNRCVCLFCVRIDKGLFRIIPKQFHKFFTLFSNKHKTPIYCEGRYKVCFFWFTTRKWIGTSDRQMKIFVVFW